MRSDRCPHPRAARSRRCRSRLTSPRRSPAGRPERWTGEFDVVFVGELDGYLDGSALRLRCQQVLKLAGLRRLRFHNLRHTFGTRTIAKADIVSVQKWMGHADIQSATPALRAQPRRRPLGARSRILADS
jgi:integrase